MCVLHTECESGACVCYTPSVSLERVYGMILDSK